MKAKVALCRTRVDTGASYRWWHSVCAAIAFAIVSLVTPASMGSASAQTTCGTTTWTLWAGQTINVGTLTVENDATNVYITYALSAAQISAGATFGTLHLWIGNDLNNLPKNGQGIPIPGQFPYQYDASGMTSYTFVIPFTNLEIQDVKSACPLQLYVVAHGEVNNVNGQGGDPQTAFGGDQTGSGPRWWFYAQYSVCCDIPDQPPPTILACTTAFGKGNWVWVTSSKANPENLPSLDLIKSRWGWALRLTSPGTYVLDLWAGAGLNDTSKGKLAGNVTVEWNGTVATVTYNTTGGYSLREVHIYAKDAKPTTTAPGQYGFTEYFDPTVTTFSHSFVLEDLDGTPGVWLIAHAVVCK